MNYSHLVSTLALGLLACAHTQSAAADPPHAGSPAPPRLPQTTGGPPAQLRQPPPPTIASHALLLPGGPDLVRMDYLAYDAAHHMVWIPAGNTGRVDVIDTTNETLRSIEGFPTSERMVRGTPRVMGPSSVTVGEGVVYVGSRGDSRVCPIDVATLHIGSCVTLPSIPDGIALVAATHEVWVTVPQDRALFIVHVDGMSAPRVEGRVPLPASPEGYAVDNTHGVFFTNLEDTDRTLAIDVHTHRVLSDWAPGCGAEGPRGLAFDAARGFLYVACTDQVVVLDPAHNGRVVSRAPTGAGVDNIDYLASTRRLYVASAAAAQLNVFDVDDAGVLHARAIAPTATGARNAVVDERGRAYVADSPGGRIFITAPIP